VTMLSNVRIVMGCPISTRLLNFDRGRNGVRAWDSRHCLAGNGRERAQRCCGRGRGERRLWWVGDGSSHQSIGRVIAFSRPASGPSADVGPVPSRRSP
jgi:hypothetical protein